MINLRHLTVICALTTSLRVSAQVYVNDSFDSTTIGTTPTVSSPVAATLQTTYQAGTGNIGTDNLININDTTASAGGLEYNVGGAALGNLYTSFNIQSNNPTGTGILSFSIGAYSTATGLQLNATAKRAFDIQLNESGSFTVKVNGSNVISSTTFTVTNAQNFKIWINDNDSSTLNYSRPDTGATATLNANSAVIFLNNNLLGTDTGFTLNTNGGLTTGNTTIGRLGFYSASTGTNNWYIDDLYIGDVSSVVPEPSFYLLPLLASGLLLRFRNQKK